MTAISRYYFANGRRAYVIISITLTALVFFWRLQVFGDLEPRGDQAFFAWWVKGLLATDHFAPYQYPGESLFDAMARDETGFMTWLLRPLYNSPTELFKIVPLFVLYGVGKLFGDSYTIQVIISLLASVIIPLVLAAFPLWRRTRENILSDYKVGLSALILGCISLYLHIFSGLGVHNYGILFLVIAVAVSVRIFTELAAAAHDRIPWRFIVRLFVVNGLALYSYKTNLFLLPPATVLALLLLQDVTWRRKLHYIFNYTLIVIVLLLPFMPLLVVAINKPDFTQGSTSLMAMATSDHFINFTEWLTTIFNHSLHWFLTARELYSLPGLAAGLVGLTILARNGTSLPLAVVITHLLSWCFVPLFASSSLRTYPYIIPFLALGGGYFIVVAFKGIVSLRINKNVVKAVAGILIIAHITSQVSGLLSKERMAEAIPRFWSLYLAGQGELRPMIADIKRALPTSATLITWGYGLQFLYRDLKAGKHKIELPAINALVLRQRAGLLKEHIRKRRLSLSATAPIYVLVDHTWDHVNRQMLSDDIATVLGPEGFAMTQGVHLLDVAHWQLLSNWPKDVALYEVVLDRVN